MIFYFILFIISLTIIYNYNNNNLEDKFDKIPRILHCTYHNFDIIPNKVWNNLKKYANEYEIRYYSDKDCIDFLNENFGMDYGDKFKSLKLGAHKADFFRYCLLYKQGGVYMDIDLEPLENLSTVIDHDTPNMMYTVLSSEESKESFLKKMVRRNTLNGNGHIFQAFIASYPGNPLFIDLINDFWIVSKPEDEYRSYPDDFKMFLELNKKGRNVLSSIPAYSTHGESQWLSPLINWRKSV